MKKLLSLFIVLGLFFPVIGLADTKVTGSGTADGVNAFTVATLPAGPRTGYLAYVTDGASATDCTTGGGSTKVLCGYNGSAWSATGGGGTATAITIADTTDTTTWVLLSQDQTGDIAPKTDGGLPYNAGTGALSPTSITPTNPVGAAYGGTGVANAAGETITIAGGYGVTFTVTEATSVQLPASGTLITATQATPPFSAVTAGTNAAALVVGTGGSLGVSGSGTINATTLLTGTWAAPGTIGSGTPNTAVVTTFYAGGGTGTCDATLASGFCIDADGDTYAKSLNTVPSATPTITIKDSDNAAGTGGIFANSSGGANDIIMSLGVEDSTGESTVYIEVDGVSETIDLLKPVAIAAAGVKLTGDNGSLTILGLGDGQDEDIKIDLNTTANTIEITSPASSATAIDFNTLNLVATGSISAGIPIGTDGDAHSVTGAEAYGYFFTATGAGTWTLPAAATGMNLCIYSTTAAAIVINPDDSDVITLNGTALSAGDSITSASGAGDFICLVAVSDASWLTLGRSGTWTDTN